MADDSPAPPPADSPAKSVDTLEELLERYGELRQCDPDDRKARRKKSTCEGKLDEFYWSRVESIVLSRLASDRDALAFSDEERLLIDFGLLDPELVEGADDDLPGRLIEEMHTPGSPNHFYFSEWLEDRYRRYMLTEQVTANARAAQAEEERQSESNALVQARRKVVSRVAPLFESLPGVPGEVARQVMSGGLDQAIVDCNLRLMETPARKLFLHRHRLRSLRAQVLEKARARVRDGAVLRIFDMLDEIYARVWREQYHEYAKRESPSSTGDADAHSPTLEKARQYLRTELHFAKTLMPLGALAGGVTRSCCVMLADEPRVTKEDTSRGLALAQVCDREFSLTPVVLIAPFKGRGIFEWDRDSLVVSQRPVENAEDSVANAAANYRMLNDTFQGEGALRSAYLQHFAGANFQMQFQADYRAWIAGAGHDAPDAIPEERVAFFVERIGPDCTAPLAPANLRNLGPQTREGIRKRLERQIASAKPDGNLHHRLAVLLWQDGRLDGATTQMAQAARLSPEDGMILFSLGLLLRARGDARRAGEIFRACTQRVAGTLWAFYGRLARDGKV